MIGELRKDMKGAQALLQREMELTSANRATFAQADILLSLAFNFRADDATAITVAWASQGLRRKKQTSRERIFF